MSAFDRLTAPIKTALDTATGAAETIAGTFHASVQGVLDLIQGSRNLAADIVRAGGALTGFAAGMAGEVSLISAGVVPYLLFGGAPLELGMAFGEACASFSQSIRGKVPQFIGVNHVKEEGLLWDTEKVWGIIYDPLNPSADAGGFLRLEEQDIYRVMGSLEENDEVRRPVYVAALLAVQDAKKRFGLELKIADAAPPAPSQP